MMMMMMVIIIIIILSLKGANAIYYNLLTLPRNVSNTHTHVARVLKLSQRKP